MNELAWVAPFKEVVLVVFFLFFVTTVFQIYFKWDPEDVRQCARIPLEDE